MAQDERYNGGITHIDFGGGVVLPLPLPNEGMKWGLRWYDTPSGEILPSLLQVPAGEENSTWFNEYPKFDKVQELPSSEVKQSKIVQAVQFDIKNVQDVYQLPCVYSVVKDYPIGVLNFEQQLTSAYLNIAFIVTGRTEDDTDIACDGDWICHLDDNTWCVLTDEAYQESLANGLVIDK